jgi:hypothetical protein
LLKTVYNNLQEEGHAASFTETIQGNFNGSD